MAGWGHGNESICHPRQGPGPNLWSSFTFWTRRLAVSRPPGASEAHTPDTEWDLIGEDRKCKHHRRCGQVQRERGRAGTNQIAVAHHMQGVLKRLTCCQEKVLGFVSGTNPAWQGSDSLAVADRTVQVQPDTFPLPLYALSTSIQLAIFTPTAVSPSCSLCVFFIYLFNLPSISANVSFLWTDLLPALSDINNSRSQ